MKLIKLSFFVILVNAFFSSSAFASKGTVILAKGAVTATATDKTSRVLAKNAAVDEGDIITTASKSFAVIRMIDNTKLTLKPDTSIAIGAYSVEEGEEEGCINLLKGGLRTVTGLIGQRKPESFQIDTPIASIGIRGTDFIVRVCAGDECLNDEQQLIYSNTGELYSPDSGDVAESINQQLPEGLYSSCETGTIVMSQCAGQTEDFEVGSCRTTQTSDCTSIELEAGNAGYAGLQPSIAGTPSSSGGRIDTLPRVPLIISRVDPYFSLSDINDNELDEVDRFPDSFGTEDQCTIYGG